MNEQTKHTPGPWDIHESEGRIEIHPADDIDGLRVIADLVFGDTLSADECRANARLIAAAPDLLEALKQILPMAEKAYCQLGAIGWKEIEYARQSINRAEGRE